MGTLYVEKGEEKGKRFSIEEGDSATVGRDSRCKLPIQDGLLSRQHFQVKEHQGDCYLRDLKSQNGTFVNGEPIDRAIKLRHGDQIRAGETLFTYEDRNRKDSELSGKVIGGYRLLKRIGRGGMGVVFRATQLSLGRDVALKVLSPPLNEDETFVELFIQEARAAGRLNHPNIVQVYDVASENGRNFISMELMEEGSVQDLLGKEKKLSVAMGVAIMLDAANGLRYAEGKKIVHRDIKPDNLMINADGMVKIADLGLAKSTHDGGMGGDEGILGTPHFISPEQAQGKPVDTRSDIYSLGATFYRLVVGTTPFQGSTAKEIVVKQIQEKPRPAREANPEVPEDVSAIIERMMEKDPDKRPATAQELIDELERIQKVHKYGKDSPLKTWVAVGAVALLLFLGGLWLTRSQEAEPQDPEIVQVPPPDRVPDGTEEKLAESQARSAFLLVQLREREQGRTGAIAEAYRTMAAAHTGTSWSDKADATATEILAEVERKERDRLARLQALEAERSRLRKTFGKLKEGVEDSITRKRYAEGLARVLTEVDPTELLDVEEYGAQVRDLLETHFRDAEAFVKSTLDSVQSSELSLEFETAGSDLEAAIASVTPPGTPVPERVNPILERYAPLKRQLEDRWARLRDQAAEIALNSDRDRFYGPVSTAYRELLPEARYLEALESLEALLVTLETEPYRRRVKRTIDNLEIMEAIQSDLIEAINDQRLSDLTVPIVTGQTSERGSPIRADRETLTLHIPIPSGYQDKRIAWNELPANTFFDLLRNGLSLPPERLVQVTVSLMERGELLAAWSLLKPFAPEPGETPIEGFVEAREAIQREAAAGRLRAEGESFVRQELWSSALGALGKLQTTYRDTREAILHSDGTSHYYSE